MKRLSRMVRKYAILGLSADAMGDCELCKTFLDEMDMYVRIQLAIKNPKRTGAEE